MNVAFDHAYNREKYRQEDPADGSDHEERIDYWEGMNDQFQTLHDKLIADGHRSAAHSLEDYISDYIAPEIVLANHALTDFLNGEE